MSPSLRRFAQYPLKLAALTKQWWRSRTIRFRLAVWYGAGGTLLLAMFSASLYYYVSERVAQPLGQHLRADMEDVKRRLQVRSDGTVLWDGRAMSARSRWTTEYPWFELWDENNQLVRRFWPFSGSRIAEQPRAPVRRSETISIFYVADDVRLRTLSAAYRPPGSRSEMVIRVMRMHEPAADALVALRWIILLALPLVVALLVLGGFALTGRWLSPLAVMASEARQINPNDRSRRLPVLNPHDELGVLATVFNETLDRLQSAFDALDRFVADASHELRTPLATLRTVGEVGVQCSSTVEESNDVIRSMLEEAQRLQTLTQRLLELAKAEGGPPIAQKTAVDLEECVLELVDELSSTAKAKGQQIIVRPQACTLNTDRILFRQALHNLLDNAIKYGALDGVITVEMRVGEKQVEITVADEGIGIRPEERGALMQRFYRPSRSRDRQSGGSGLGLSITKAYMHVLSGALDYSPRHPVGSIFRLTLPKTAFLQTTDVQM
jgi:signal transduction histidine kinase